MNRSTPLSVHRARLKVSTLIPMSGPRMSLSPPGPILIFKKVSHVLIGYLVSSSGICTVKDRGKGFIYYQRNISVHLGCFQFAILYVDT